MALDAAAARFAEAAHKGRLEHPALHATPASERNLPEEVLEAQSQVALNLNRLVLAISRQQFVQARFYFNQECKARQELRQAREKYGIRDAR